MKIKLRKFQILVSICALQLSACALIQEDKQEPFTLLSPSVMAMIQQDAMNKVRNSSDEEGEEAPENLNAISIEALLRNALQHGSGTAAPGSRPAA